MCPGGAAVTTPAFYPASSFVPKVLRKSARKRLESPLRGRDAAPPRRRPHSGSQGRTRWLFSLPRQLLLCQLTLGGSFCKVHLMLGVQLYCFTDRANVVTQVAIFLQPVLHDDRRRLYGDEPLFYQSGHITLDGTFAFADGFSKRLVAGPAFMCLTVFQTQQQSVDCQLTGCQMQRENFVRQRRKVFHFVVL